MDKPTVMISDDYAVLSCDWGEFYYGYEETTEDGEWCFSADIKGLGEKIIIPSSELPVDKWICEQCLLAGIGLVLDQKYLEE